MIYIFSSKKKPGSCFKKKTSPPPTLLVIAWLAGIWLGIAMQGHGKQSWPVSHMSSIDLTLVTVFIGDYEISTNWTPRKTWIVQLGPKTNKKTVIT